MSMSIEERFNKYITAYKEGDYSLVRREWRMLSSEERLNIYYLLYKTNNIKFIDFEQFKVHYSDLKLIQEAKIKCSKEIGLTVEQQKEIYYGLKFTGKSKDYDDEVVLRNIIAYGMFREHAEVFKDNPVFKELISENLSLINCDPRRTNARICLLMNLGGHKNNIEDFIQELMLSREEFDYLYRETMEDKLYEWQEKDLDSYNELMRGKNDPFYMDSKELEEGLAIFYSDVEYAKNIEKQKRKIEYHTPQKVENSADIEMVDLFGETVMEKETDPTGKGRTPNDVRSTSKGNASKIEAINQQRVKTFIHDAKETGFNYLGVITTEGGVKGKGEDEVFYHVLEKSGKRYMVPIGQVGNSMFLITNDEISFEELKPLMKSGGRDKLVKDGVLKRKYNKRTEDKAYDYDVALQLLINWDVLNSEGATDRKKVINKAKKSRSISDVKKEVIEIIPKEETKEAAEYVSNKLIPISIEGHTFFVEESTIKDSRSPSLKLGPPPRTESTSRRSRFSSRKGAGEGKLTDEKEDAFTQDVVDLKNKTTSGGDHDEF